MSTVVVGFTLKENFMAPKIKKLEKLATLLEALPRERFDYEHWVGPKWEGKKDLSCGTTACALGWATTLFKKLELRACVDEASMGDRTMYCEVVLAGTDLEDFGAAAKFFNISMSQAEVLFSPSVDFNPDSWEYDRNGGCESPNSSATPKQVAKHIQKFVSFLRKQENNRLKAKMGDIGIGDKVRRVNSDYEFVGTVVSVFTKTTGLVRYVVEDERGVLFIWNRKNMELATPA